MGGGGGSPPPPPPSCPQSGSVETGVFADTHDIMWHASSNPHTGAEHNCKHTLGAN